MVSNPFFDYGKRAIAIPIKPLNADPMRIYETYFCPEQTVRALVDFTGGDEKDIRRFVHEWMKDRGGRPVHDYSLYVKAK
jgi:hypothetical protein